MIFHVMQGYISKAFVPLIRSMWPGIDGISKSSSFVVSNQRKRSVQASKFILQMMQTPLYKKETRREPESQFNKSPDTPDDCIQPPLDCTEEGLAIRIAVEVGCIPLAAISYCPLRIKKV